MLWSRHIVFRVQDDMKIKKDISLSSAEEELFDFFREVTKTQHVRGTIVRVAGGWVRDKLLGLESNDIDICLSDMTGLEFAEACNATLKAMKLPTQPIAVVKANPAQSKHLETAIMTLFGQSIDMVNLRTETYTEGSRIPDMKFGTPKEDAERRDLTINAMFYNVNDSEIEDYCGGLVDLRQSVARTPLDPIKTFRDDPLRMLRAIRFATRFDLFVDNSIFEAARDESVIDAFKNKVSNERIFMELFLKDNDGELKAGALGGKNPTSSIELLKAFGLMEIIFDPSPEEMESLGFKEDMVPWETDQNNPHHDFDIWIHTTKVLESLVKITPEDIKKDPELYVIRNTAALLHDIGKRYVGIQGVHEEHGHSTYRGHEETSAEMAEVVLTRLCAPNSFISRVKELVAAHLRPHVLMEGRPKAYRRFVRGFDDWEHCIDIANADNLGKRHFDVEDDFIEWEAYEALKKRIREAIPENFNKGKIVRPINGRDLMELGIKPGPIMGKIFDEIDETLLEFPDLSRDGAIEIANLFVSV